MSIIDSFVEAVVGKLGEALLQPIIREVMFLRGVADKVQCLQKELKAMQCFLKDADAKQEADELVKNWVQDVREVARDAEDAIDIFACKISPVRHEGWRGKLRRYGLTKYVALHDLGEKIDGINATLTEISRRRKRYGINSITGSEIRSSLRRVSYPHVPEPDFVGLEEQLNSLIDHLIGEEKPCRVVSLVGMGGLGKTTLAKKACKAVEEHFSRRAWVFVSQQFSVRDLLQDIGRQCSVDSSEELQRVTDAELSRKIFESLQSEKYLIVLDDIWDKRAWDCLEKAFPNESNGSRILLTTREREVALLAGAGSKPHELPFLNEDESWQLFCKKAFLGPENYCPSYLEQTAREIVKKCGGLPLAIVVMGGLLLVKEKEESEWGKVLKSIHWQFKQEEYPVLDILSLSYHHLPYSTKPCFLYLASFPEDYRFPADRLIRLWAAEGFLQQRGQVTPEEVGADVLKDLIWRNLIQVADTSSSGLIETCRIHDLLREFCVKKAAEEGFIEVRPCSSKPASAPQGYRLALHGKEASDTANLISTPSHHPRRSVFLFNENQKDEMTETRQLQRLLTSFELLRVLDLDGVLIRELPGAIGKLVLLRYLRCSNSRMESLPSSMANLRYLQTLDVARCQVNGVLLIPSPVKMMLQGLRHLRLVTYVESYRIRDQCRNVEPYLSKNFFNTMSTMIDKLMFVRYEERVGLEGTTESSSVSGLSLIDKSVISASSSSSMLQRPLLTSCQLFIDGKLSKLPDQPCDFPSNLFKLELVSSHLEMDPLPLLEKLEYLRFLVLDLDSYLGKKMACSAQGFPQLQSLQLRNLDNLEEWRVEEGAMPCLSYLQITCCTDLKMLPEGLKYLRKLKILEINAMPRTFTDRIRAHEGEDCYKIQHIPQIKIVPNSLL